MFKLEIAFDPQSGTPFLVEDHPGASWLKLYPNHKAMLAKLLRQATPKGYNEKHFMSALMVLCGDTPEPDNRTCLICDGGPGNDCACSCPGGPVYERPPSPLNPPAFSAPYGAAEPKREHVWFKCPEPCPRHEEGRHCGYCDGGLAFCTVCEMGEGDLADECPGPAVAPRARVERGGMNDDGHE
jgi:hypothetical protein